LWKASTEFAFRLGEQKMDIPGVAFLEAGFAVTKIIKPCPSKMFVISQFFNSVLVFEEAKTPLP
jgi:hypothetical protein